MSYDLNAVPHDPVAQLYVFSQNPEILEDLVCPEKKELSENDKKMVGIVILSFISQNEDKFINAEGAKTALNKLEDRAKKYLGSTEFETEKKAIQQAYKILKME